jgi:hypothetical protein
MSKKKGTLWYVGLESITSRYTLQLTQWNERVFQAAESRIPYRIVLGNEIDQSKNIEVGQVLDAMGRPYYAMSQIQELIKAIKSGELTEKDTIFFEDMFHPGFEALPYMFNQLGWRPKIFVRCLAQTIDPDDFVHVAKMTEWMRKFEAMVNSCVDAVLIASHEMASYATAAGWTVPLIVTGLPFGREEVRERAEHKEPKSPAQRNAMWESRPLKVVFAARTDQEKQPAFFCELARRWRDQYTVPVEFAFLSGKKLTSNSIPDLNHIRSMEEQGYVKVYEGLSKAEYYQHLKYSRVLFNCALQDWVSNTVSEADALGCNVLYPAYRSFPEVFGSDHTRLYVPWSLADATVKLRRLLLKPHPYMGGISERQDRTIHCSVVAMHLWQKGKPTAKQDLGGIAPVINPRDTKYRASLSYRDWNLDEVGNDFWEYGKVTDQQLKDSLRKTK